MIDLLTFSTRQQLYLSFPIRNCKIQTKILNVFININSFLLVKQFLIKIHQLVQTIPLTQNLPQKNVMEIHTNLYIFIQSPG